MKPTSYPEKDRRQGRTNIKKDDSLAKTAAALFADLFYDQYLHSKRSRSESSDHEQKEIDDKCDL
jgi:hypothetical protein